MLPGLIDMHVHLAGDPSGEFWREAVDSDEYQTLVGVKNARITARAGFTTVRDLGSPPLVGFALARGTAENLFPAPASSPRARPFRSSAAMATSTASAPR